MFDFQTRGRRVWIRSNLREVNIIFSIFYEAYLFLGPIQSEAKPKSELTKPENIRLPKFWFSIPIWFGSAYELITSSKTNQFHAPKTSNSTDAHNTYWNEHNYHCCNKRTCEKLWRNQTSYTFALEIASNHIEISSIETHGLLYLKP